MFNCELRDVDVTFFVATVDLWSEDGKAEQNLVLNTMPLDRPHSQPSRRRRRGTVSNVTDNRPQELVLTPEDDVALSSPLPPPAPHPQSQPQIEAEVGQSLLTCCVVFIVIIIGTTPSATEPSCSCSWIQ
jgi:hypothetical protein